MRRALLLPFLLPCLLGSDDGCFVDEAKNDAEEVFHQVTLRNGSQFNTNQSLHVLQEDEEASGESLLAPGETRIVGEYLPKGERAWPAYRVLHDGVEVGNGACEWDQPDSIDLPRDDLLVDIVPAGNGETYNVICYNWDEQ